MRKNGSRTLYEKLGNFVAIPDLLFKRGRFLTVQAKWVYATLRSFTNNETERTFPDHEKIIERSGLKRNAVANALSELEKFGWIRKFKRFGKSTEYLLTAPSRIKKPEELGPCPTEEMAAQWKKKRKQKRISKDPNISTKSKLLKMSAKM